MSATASNVVSMEVTTTLQINWNDLLLEQLDWHWRHQLRPRLDGLTDAEYRWEPRPDAWNVRPRGTSTAPIALGSGDFTIDFALHPAPHRSPRRSWDCGTRSIKCEHQSQSLVDLVQFVPAHAANEFAEPLGRHCGGLFNEEPASALYRC